MKAVRMLKTEKGFSLIELMIVVAIIGILATVAIPNFTKFQAKARASESRAQLAALFTAEKAFNAEWNDYLSDITSVGYRPNGALRYLVGFNAAYAGAAPYVAAVAAGQATYAAANLNTNVTCPTVGCTNIAVNVAGASITTATAGVPTITTFLAQAQGYVGGTAIDTWTINENKVVLNSVPGGY
jgi:type IV pilus assembly protein PilA